jgi:hypothetical protein
MLTKDKRWSYKRPLVLIPLVVAALSVLLVAFAIFSTVIESNRPTYYERGSDFPLDELPPSAHDVRFAPTAAFAPMGTAYEFRCTEAEYLDWVERTRREYPELSEVRTQDSGQHVAIDRSGKAQIVRLRDFLISEWRFEDQGFYLVYDPAAGRAIRWSHSR